MKFRRAITYVLSASLSLAGLAALPSHAATATGNFDVVINLTSSCRLTTTPSNITLSYTSFQATAPTPATTSIAVQCTNTLPYSMDIGTATSTMAGVNLAYTLAIRNADDTADIAGLPTQQIAGAAPTSYLIKATMTAGQQGTCASATCSGTATRTLTITY